MLDYLTLINMFLVVLLLLTICTYYYRYKKVLWLWAIFFILFLASSTKILPATLIANYEGKTPIFNTNSLDKSQIYYLHVLGAGYSLDPNLPATSQLSTTTLARLVEAIRISKYLPQYKIVSSGYSKLDLESQASVVRRAAIELGIPPQNCEILPTPTNTSQEVKAFVSRFGSTKNVIVVSDAMHLPRAAMLYKKAGIIAIGAPTNFRIKKGANDNTGIRFPSLSSMNLLNDYLRERLKYWKDEF